ncbi:von Willebrand factor type A [Gracilaria domingensis]|nr:von Willebrand factor type A [Gracilaria domingensis]
MKGLTILSLLSLVILASAQFVPPVPVSLPFGLGDIPLSITPRIQARIDDTKARIESIRSPLVSRPQGARALALAFGEVAEGGCDPNVCFALDGSVSIDEDSFQLQKDFVKLVAGVISLDEQSQFAALQYGITTSIISDLTIDANDFLLKVDAAVQIGASRTFVARGIFGCVLQLLRTPFEANHIVLLGDGEDSDLSRFTSFGSAGIARQFLRNPNNQISAVAVGFSDTSGLESIVGSPDRVFTVDQWAEVVDVTADLVADVCGVDAIEF